MTSIHDLHPDVVGQVLRHIDGPTLAAASCSSPLLRSLASDPALWRHLCLSTWPSLAHPRLLPLLSRPRRFFSQASPFPVSGFPPSAAPAPGRHGDKDVRAPDGADLPAEIISAVDIHHGGVPVLSRVVETGTSSSWFLTSPFRVDALDRKDPEHVADTGRRPAIDPGELTLSWTVIDPAARRAVNLSSRRPVSVDRHWYTGETLVRFAVVVGGCAVNAVVTCGEGEGQVREAVLTVEDLDGRSVSGRESLGVLKAAMEGGRRGAKWEEEIAGNYREFLRRKRERRERKVRREGILDLCCTAFGALMFLIFVMLMLSR